MRPRLGPLVFTQLDVDAHEASIREAFESGHPDQVWSAVTALLTELRHFVDQAARDRFEQNFGTAICRSCDGLKTGPDVVATCLQVEQCYFTNRKASDLTTTQHSLLERLTRMPKK